MHPKENIYSEEMGFGVSMQPPSTFKRAKSYLGFQAPHKMGSISLEMNETYEQIKIMYSKENIDSRGGVLHRYQPVSYNGNTDAFYVEFYDNPQKRYRQVLVISEDDKVYHIKGFHRGKPNNPLSNKIRMALLTTNIGEYKKEEKPFSKVFFADDLEHFKYTRDNKYPTEEADSMVVYVTTLAVGELESYNERDYLERIVKAITNGETSNSREQLENGIIFKCTSITDTKHVLGILLVADQSEATLIECIGNEKANLKEVSNYMLSQVVSIM
tara:strand:- start:262 stop:1077 length:816 start_codon:yes stop_codon:yes gene_type:complete